jgi:hypothetical protein
MDPRTRNAILITVVAVFALGVSAATLTSTVESGSDGAGGGGGVQPPSGTPDFDLEDPRGGDSLPPVVARIIAALFVLGALGCLVYGLLYRKRAAVVIGLLVGAVVVLWLFAQLIGALTTPDGAFGGWFGGLSGLTGGDGTGGGDLRSFRTLASLVAAVGLAVLVAYLFAGSSRSVSGAERDGTDEAAPDTEDVTEMGRIAGRTADRIESRDADEALDNQVYEAYSEMTDQIDVPTDRSTTPREFADAAADRGMADDDVAALTDLFEAVRYGGYPATADREREAVETLRRIERRYTDE